VKSSKSCNAAEEAVQQNNKHLQNIVSMAIFFPQAKNRQECNNNQQF